MTLVPREGYGLGFMIALFMVAVALVGKGNALAALIYGNNSNTGYSYRILYWICTNALPSFCYVSTYSILLVVHTYVHIIQINCRILKNKKLLNN